MVSIELAFGIMLSAVLAMGLSYLIAIVVQIGQLQATAGEVARQHARGDTAAAQRATKDAPTGAVVRLSGSGPDVVVIVELRSQPWGGLIPPLPLRVRAVVAREAG